MANEEQRKAFAAYMGGGGGGSSSASAGQPIPQYPGLVANPASQYLFNVSFICSMEESSPSDRRPSDKVKLRVKVNLRTSSQCLQPPPPTGYNVGWRCTDPNASSISGAMAPTQLNGSSVAHSNDKRVDEHFSYHYQAGTEAPTRVEEQTVPVLLCHTCRSSVHLVQVRGSSNSVPRLHQHVREPQGPAIEKRLKSGGQGAQFGAVRATSVYNHIHAPTEL
ncbi:hypothetical protein E8E12_009560 [Didymella heteroderae]|uniref:Uncharacterized protein n=1 Tax=Didymella heteroderae TaxID=1769908 RepID=A0A9P4WZG6_9PLEO|nr:hypothetical protein E8E12_009560 [Didymella heteroderae]